MKYIFRILFCLSTTVICAQSGDFAYKPERKDSLREYIARVNAQKVNDFSPKLQRKVKEILAERQAAMIQDIEDSVYIFDKTINRSLGKILAEIYRVNPQIKHNDYYFLINKSMLPNAACYGNGIFSVNLGLFSLTQTDDELAAVMAHEIAHHLLEHTDNSIERHLTTFNSRDVKRRVNKAENQKYGRRAAVNALARELRFNFMQRSRRDELQADSLGFQLFQKTKFNKRAFTDVLRKLDFSDEIVFSRATNLRKHFDFRDYPFKDAWLSDEGALFEKVEATAEEVSERDSLETHPDITLRIEKLEKLYPMASTPSSAELADVLRHQSARNSVRIFFDAQRIDLALYEILSQYENGDIDARTYSGLLARLLRQTYLLKDRHLFGKYVSPMNRLSDERQINEIRLFLNNLELKNIRKIGYFFCLQHEAQAKGDSDFDEAFAFFKELNQTKK